MVSFVKRTEMLRRKKLIEQDLQKWEIQRSKIEEKRQDAIWSSLCAFACILGISMFTGIINQAGGMTVFNLPMMIVLDIAFIALCVLLVKKAPYIFAIYDVDVKHWVRYDQMLSDINKKIIAYTGELEHMNGMLEALGIEYSDEEYDAVQTVEADDLDLEDEHSKETTPTEETLKLFGADTMPVDVQEDEELGLTISLEDAMKSLQDENDEDGEE